MKQMKCKSMAASASGASVAVASDVAWGRAAPFDTGSRGMRQKQRRLGRSRALPSDTCPGVIRMALLATERLTWHCGDHTAKLESASRDDSLLLPNSAVSVAHVGAHRNARDCSREGAVEKAHRAGGCSLQTLFFA